MTLSTTYSNLFQGSFARRFPGLSHEHEMRPKLTPHVLFARTNPTPVKNPELIAWSNDVANYLGLPRWDILQSDAVLRKDWAAVYSGNMLLPGMDPIATRYGGHQFGHWAGQLGDGRAILLGDVRVNDGSSWEVQLKGAGPTPYSRRADGRAVLRSSLREYLCSEAMHYLRVPTTRALCCVLTGDLVVRDMFYDGRPEEEPGAITTRVAPSFLRFGHFEILAADGEFDLLKDLINYAVNVTPGFSGRAKGWDEELVTEWFKELCLKTADLMAQWLRVGFVHGVMNTDNMSILGLTIDYGPYGWLDVYDPTWTPNTTDFERRRYRYEAQPQIAHWNLAQLGSALAAVMSTETGLEEALQAYAERFKATYRSMRFAKLGMTDFGSPDDIEIVESLDVLLTATEVDMTIFYRSLSKGLSTLGFFDADLDALESWLKPALYSEVLKPAERSHVLAWLRLYGKRMAQESRPLEDIVSQMDSVNPYFILRNYLVQTCLDEFAAGKRDLLDGLSEALKTPYEENEVTKPFFVRRPDWARNRPGCSALSCSS